jgi:hypothetical protein
MKQNSNEFNTLFGLREEIRPGTLDILTDTWNSAKAFLKTMKVNGGRKWEKSKREWVTASGSK